MVGRTLGLTGAFGCAILIACAGRSVNEGEVSGTGGAGNAGKAGNAGSPGTHIGGGGWKGGTVNAEDASSVVVAAIGRGYAGAGCEDDGTGPDPVGILMTGTTVGVSSEFTDHCDADGNLVEYFCTNECTLGVVRPPYDGPTVCMMNGSIDSIRVRCNGTCLDGRCAPPA
jgi:hypothetical protein